MQECRVTMHFWRGTPVGMSDSWEIRYLRHVEKQTGQSLSAIATAAGLSTTTLTRPVNSATHKFSVKLATLDAVQNATGVPYAPFQHGGIARVENGDPAPDGGRLVPVYDVTASAGQGLLAPDYEYVAYNLSFPPDYLRSITSTATGKLAIISVKGDSMSPTLNDDDIVLLDTTKTSLSYEGLFVVRIDEALQVKRLSHSRPGFVFVTSDNKDKYPVREHPKPEVEVIGKVLWSGGKVS